VRIRGYLSMLYLVQALNWKFAKTHALEYDNNMRKTLYFVQIIMYEIHKCEFKSYYCS